MPVPEYEQRASRGVALAAVADLEAVRAEILELLLDPWNTHVTLRTAAALVERRDLEGLRLLVEADARADANQGDWIASAVGNFRAETLGTEDGFLLGGLRDLAAGAGGSAERAAAAALLTWLLGDLAVRADAQGVAAAALAQLQQAGVRLRKGLRERELRGIEVRFGFEFAPDHRALLLLALPVGDGWVDWRGDAPGELQGRLDWPADGVLFDVRSNGFWPGSWPRRPDDPTAAEEMARRQMAGVPVLVPLYAHRYLPAHPVPHGAPVFSVHQTDTIYYGDDLADYVAREFGPTQPSTGPANPNRLRIAFWSDLADDLDAAEF